MLIVPITDAPSQTMQVTLGGQPCTIELQQKDTGLFMNLYVSGTLILGGVICENLNRIVREDYLGFVGDLFFNDETGTDDPSYPGLGTRFVLFYMEAADLVIPA